MGRDESGIDSQAVDVPDSHNSRLHNDRGCGHSISFFAERREWWSIRVTEKRHHLLHKGVNDRLPGELSGMAPEPHGP